MFKTFQTPGFLLTFKMSTESRESHFFQVDRARGSGLNSRLPIFLETFKMSAESRESHFLRLIGHEEPGTRNVLECII
jgi:hypothetical protein